MKKIYILCLLVIIGLASSCKRDTPLYPGDKGYVADSPPTTTVGTGTGTGTGGTGTGTGGTGTGTGGTGTGTGGTGTGGTGTGGTGTGGVTPVTNGNGLPLGALNTLLYKVQGVTYTCSTEVGFAIDLQANAILTGQADQNGGPWVCGVNISFVGNTVGTFDMKPGFFLEDAINNTSLTLVDGKVAITSIHTSGYLGTLQGTFNTNMTDASGTVYNVIGSFNISQ
jgi:hypothetical protein